VPPPALQLRWPPLPGRQMNGDPSLEPKSHPAVLCCFSGWPVLQASQRERARWALLVTVVARMLFCELKGRIRPGWMQHGAF
jgi:hypothetical protein